MKQLRGQVSRAIATSGSIGGNATTFAVADSQ
jgi:hypothetical protein